MIISRNYNWTYRSAKDIKSQYAIIGMGIILEGYPLYDNATNEKGLSIARFKLSK